MRRDETYVINGETLDRAEALGYLQSLIYSTIRVSKEPSADWGSNPSEGILWKACISDKCMIKLTLFHESTNKKNHPLIFSNVTTPLRRYLVSKI